MTQNGLNGDAAQRRRILLVAGASFAALVIGAVVVVAYDVGGLRTSAVNQVGEVYGDAVYRNMHDKCVSSANDTIRKSGADPDAADMHGKITGYCDCVVAEVRVRFTLSEIADLEKDPARISENPKMKALIERCVAKFKS